MTTHCLAVVFTLTVLALPLAAPAAHAADPKLAGKTVPMDQDKDGKPDHWVTYDSRGVGSLIASDTNGDGKMDSWKHPIRGLMILRENDRNFDGRVDERMVTDLIYDNVVKISRHLPIWREADDDFDGTIDTYRVRGEQNPSPNPIGQKIDTTPWSEAKEAAEKASAGAGTAGPAQEQVRQMNARQNLGR